MKWQEDEQKRLKEKQKFINKNYENLLKQKLSKIGVNVTFLDYIKSGLQALVDKWGPSGGMPGPSKLNAKLRHKIAMSQLYSGDIREELGQKFEQQLKEKTRPQEEERIRQANARKEELEKTRAEIKARIEKDKAARQQAAKERWDKLTPEERKAEEQEAAQKLEIATRKSNEMLEIAARKYKADYIERYKKQQRMRQLELEEDSKDKPLYATRNAPSPTLRDPSLIWPEKLEKKTTLPPINPTQKKDSKVNLESESINPSNVNQSKELSPNKIKAIEEFIKNIPRNQGVQQNTYVQSEKIKQQSKVLVL